MVGGRPLTGEHAAARRWRLADLRRLVAFMAKLAWRADRRRVALVVGLEAAQALGLGVGLLALHGVLRQVLAIERSEERPAEMALSVGVLLGLGLVGAVMGVVSRAQESVLTLKIQREAADRVVTAASSVELLAFEQPELHDRIERATLAADSHAPMMVSLGLTVLRSALAVVGVGVALLTVAWWLGPLLLVAALPSVRVALLRERSHHALQVALMENRRMRAYLTEVLTGRDEAKEVRACNLAKPLRRRLADCYAMAVAHEERFQRRFAWRAIVARGGGDLVIAVAAGGVLALSAAGHLDLAAALAALGALYMAATQAAAISGTSSLVGGSVRFLDDLRAFVSPASSPPARSVGDARPFARLEARHVSFSYPGTAEPALRDVSMHVAAGEIVALVGENGSGKTTLAKILTGLYEPATGELVCDGAPAEPARLRAVSAVLFQDYLRYKLDAADNIALGRPECHGDRCRIEGAARKAGIHATLAALPHGYDTMLSREFSHGTDLSLGQWQRVALARAFFRDAPFVVLDEPTASLDPRSEAALFSHMRDLFRGRAVLLISHRFSTVRAADRIYVLGAGRVVEHGTHSSLLAADGLYAELFRSQAAAYADTDVPGAAAPMSVAPS